MIYKSQRLDNYDAFGTVYKFIGPHLNGYDGYKIHILQPFNEWAQNNWEYPVYSDNEADNISRMLNIAYEAGRDSMRSEFRLLLGLRNV